MYHRYCIARIVIMLVITTLISLTATLIFSVHPIAGHFRGRGGSPAAISVRGRGGSPVRNLRGSPINSLLARGRGTPRGGVGGTPPKAGMPIIRGT